MERCFILICFFVFGIANAQPGDFQLTQPGERTYVKIPGNSSLHGNGFTRILVGNNYRGEWTDSIRVPVLNFKNDFGGIKPEKEGGGKQTHSLHITSGDGRKWVLRSVEKFPDKVIGAEFKGTFAEDLLNDGISASYPYSVLSVGTLAKAVGVPYLPNILVYIPDDPKLGAFRSKYKNTLSFLELTTIENDKNKKTYGTEEIIPELQKSNKIAIDQPAVLRARLLDNFIMDFDRHNGQWLWTEKEAGGRKYYYPIPKDRDQAFFKAEGFLPKLISGQPSLGQIQGLRAKPKNILSFNYAGKDFDRGFLNELDEQSWSKEIDRFLTAMSDDVIETAIKKQPLEIQKYHATAIADILKNKRASFKSDMMHYYRFLSRTVSITGSNEVEKFIITKNGDGSVNVTVQNKNEHTLYDRTFDPPVTKEIRVYGLEGNDEFSIRGDQSPIRIRIIGGPGEDQYTDDAKSGKAYVYDVSFEKNTLAGNGFINKISKDPLTNEYRRMDFEYNSSSVGIYPEYSTDGGLFLGPSYTITTHGFRKEPYAARHFMYFSKAFSSPAWHLHYDADFIKPTNHTDLLLRTDAKLPTVRTHFFGIGNNTIYDKTKDLDYYKIEYTLVDASVMARHSITNWLQLSYGPLLQYFKILPGKNDAHYIRNIIPGETDEVYAGKWYTGAAIHVNANTKNNALIPTRGINANLYARELAGINKNTNSFMQAGGDVSLYTDVIFKNHVIIATSFGAQHNFGSFEIPQAAYLGFKQNLRGYRYQRFAGRSAAYNNTELRINFGAINLYVIKGPLGVLGFHDIGRVWADREKSDTWHRGYGGGIWLAPFNKVLVAATLTTSKEDTFPMITFGFQF